MFSGKVIENVFRTFALPLSYTPSLAGVTGFEPATQSVFIERTTLISFPENLARPVSA